MFSRSVFLTLAMLLAASSAFAQNTWYVDVNGTAPGTGTIDDPYTSIQYAVVQSTTVTGDTLLVAPGEYNESVNIYGANKWLTVRSLGGPEVTTIRSSGFVGVALLGTLEGFTVRSANAGQGTAVESCGSTVRRCVLTGAGLGFYACTDCWLEESTVTGNSRGLDISSYDLLRLENSIVWGNGWDGLHPGNMLPRYSLSSAPLPGPGNLVGNPSFWNAASGDVHLRPGSICIDAGDPTSPLDPNGSPIDIGALAYDSGYAFGPATYCAGKLNSQGCVPSIGWSGACSATSPTKFVVSAIGIVTDKVGILYYGFGSRAEPFQGGLLCVLPPITRCEPVFSGSNELPPPGNYCSGAYEYDFNARIQSGAHPNLTPGGLVYAQYWHRDPLDPAGFGSGLTDGICFGIAP